MLLVYVAVRLAARERDLLTNLSAPPTIVAKFRQVILNAPDLVRVDRLDVVVVGPRMWLVTADVVLAAALSASQAIDALDGIRSRLRDNPGVAHVYLTPIRP